MCDHSAYEFETGLNSMSYQKFGECVRRFQCMPYILVILEIHPKERFEFLYHEAQHLFIQSRIHTDPEGAVHNGVGVNEFATDTIRPALKIGLACEVASKQQARADLVLIKVFQ